MICIGKTKCTSEKGLLRVIFGIFEVGGNFGIFHSWIKSAEPFSYQIFFRVEKIKLAVYLICIFLVGISTKPTFCKVPTSNLFRDYDRFLSPPLLK